MIDQQFGATIQLVGDIEQMLGQAVRRQARQQLPSDPKVYFGACAFGNERIGRLLNPVVEEGIRSLQTGEERWVTSSIDRRRRIR